MAVRCASDIRCHKVLEGGQEWGSSERRPEESLVGTIKAPCMKFQAT